MRPAATALHRHLDLARIPAFLDSVDLKPGDHLSGRLLDAVLAARVVVVVLDQDYFTRPYCMEELDATLGAYRELVGRGASSATLQEALLPLVVTLPAGGQRSPELGLLPPEIRNTSWPKTEAADEVSRLVARRLAMVDRTIGQRLEALGVLSGLRDRLLAGIDMPPPGRLRPISVVCRPPGGLPASLDADFIGRAGVLWTLDHALAAVAVGRAEPAVALAGPAGAGKTQLAAEYVWRYGSGAYRGGLIWIDADVSDDRLEAQLHAALRALRPDVPELAGFRMTGRDVRDELGLALREATSRGRILYVVDDVPESRLADHPISHWCPAQGDVALIVTSRGRTTLAPGVQAQDVSELAVEPAVALLRHEVIARDSLHGAEWEEIARWVDGLPLALRVLNAALRSRAVSPGELLTRSRVDRPAPAVDELRREALPGARLRGVAEAFDTMYDRLPTPAARRTARLVACLAPAPIPAALAAGLLTVGDRALLSARSLVGPVRSGTPEMFGRMHPVLADHLRGLAGDRRELLLVIGEVALEIMTPEACGDPAAWSLLDVCRPHAEAAMDQWRDLRSPGPDEASARFVRLGLIVGHLIRQQGRPDKAAAWASRSLDLGREALGSDHPNTLEAMGSLAAALFDQGQLTVPRRLQEQVLEARVRVLGEEHEATLRAKGALASTLHALGRRVDALRLGEETLAARVHRLGPEHADTLWSTAAVARTLHALHRLGRATELGERLLDARRRLLGPEHPDTLEAMEILAALARDRGHLGRALQLGEGALEARIRLLGEEHPSTLEAMGGVALTLRAMGAPGRAADLLGRIMRASSPRS